MDYTKSIGSITELQCISKFIELGFDCSIPYGDACKYDFIADVNGKLLKIQCKSCSHPIKNGIRDTNSIAISCISQTTNTQKTIRHKYTSDMIDYFATYFDGNVYLIPVEECSFQKRLRLAPPKNNNQKYNKAEDYLIEKVLKDKQDVDFLKQKENIKNLQLSQPKIFYCSQCNKNIVSKENGICTECKSFNNRVVKNRPDRKELKNMIRQISFEQIGRNYGVSSNAIRKWCVSYDLPSRKKEINEYTDEEWSKI